MLSKDELIEIISSEIESYLAESQNNVDKLSQQTGVSRTSIERYHQNKHAMSTLIAENAFAFLSYFRGQAKAAMLMKNAYPRWWRLTGRFVYENKPSKPRSIAMDKYSKYHSLMLNQATKERLTNKWILKYFEKRTGYSIRDDLLEAGLIVEKDGIYVSPPTCDTDYRHIMKRIAADCEAFPFESVGNGAFVWEFYELMPPGHRQQVNAAFNLAGDKIRELKASLRGMKKTDDWELFKINLFGGWNKVTENDIDQVINQESSNNKNSIKQGSTEEKLQLLTENTKMLAHDVRRPLTMIKSLIDMLQNANNTSQLNELASQGAEDVKRAIASVNESIKATLADNESRNFEKSEVSLYEIIFEVLKDIFSYRGCELQIFKFKFNHDSLLFIDKEKIKRVITNIVINAVEASPTSQTIWFQTSSNETMIDLTIGNSGSHISSDRLERIFELGVSEGKPDGNGIGLSIAQKFVKAHGGDISCYSDEKGVEFRMQLPLAKNSQGRENEAVMPETNLEVSRFSEIKFKATDSDDDELYFLKVLNRYRKQKLKIAICDDDSLYINGLVNNFRKYPHITKNLEIISCSDPNDILNEMADVYILDYDYGEDSQIDGLEAAKLLRKQGRKGIICLHSNVLQLVGTSALPDDVDMGYPKPMSQNKCLDILVEGFERQMEDRSFDFQLDPIKDKEDSKKISSITINESCFYGKIAVIDDDPVSFILNTNELRDHGCHVLEYKTLDYFIDAIEDNSLNLDEIDCIITDMNIGSMDVSKVSFPELMREKLKFFKPIFITSYNFEKIEKNPFKGFKYAIPKEDLQEVIISNLKVLAANKPPKLVNQLSQGSIH